MPQLELERRIDRRRKGKRNSVLVPPNAYDHLIMAGNEYQRSGYISRVNVDEKGVARSIHHRSNIKTTLVAVRLDGRNASIEPFTQTESGLLLPFSKDDDSRLGFFIGHNGTNMAAVIREGDYPGSPLKTSQNGTDGNIDTLLGINGVSPRAGVAEARWLSQIGFVYLGLNPYKTLALFPQSMQGETNFSHQRTLQIQTYDLKPQVEEYDRQVLIGYDDIDYVRRTKNVKTFLEQKTIINREPIRLTSAFQIFFV